VNANELLTLLGLAWSRLIIYPGGLAAFTLIWLITRTKNGHPQRQPRTGTRSVNQEPTNDNQKPRTDSRQPAAENWESRSESQFWQADNGSWLLVLSSIVLPWLGLALLPLPAAAPMSRKTDIIMVLALLEWPRIVTIAQELRAADEACQRAGERRLAAALNSYPTLMLATLALTQPAGSFEIAALARPPIETAALSIQALHWLGAAAWTLALAPLLGLGPFQARTPAHNTWRSPITLREWGMWLRGCGLASIAAVAWLAPFGVLAEHGSYSTATLLAIVLVPFALGCMAWLYHRCTAHQSARRWARVYLALDYVLLLALLWAGYATFSMR
jgi:hypothetical protein